METLNLQIDSGEEKCHGVHRKDGQASKFASVFDGP